MQLNVWLICYYLEWETFNNALIIQFYPDHSYELRKENFKLNSNYKEKLQQMKSRSSYIKLMEDQTWPP